MSNVVQVVFLIEQIQKAQAQDFFIRTNIYFVLICQDTPISLKTEVFFQPLNFLKKLLMSMYKKVRVFYMFLSEPLNPD